MTLTLRRDRGRTTSGRRVHSQVAQTEAYRILRSHLSVALDEIPRPTVLVTSAQPNEGKTTVTANLAASFAAAGRRVGLVDLDLRHPDLHNWFGVPCERGVSDVLLGRRSLEECLLRIDVQAGAVNSTGALYLLPTGPTVEQATELLGAGRVARLFDAMTSSTRPRPSVDGTSRPLDLILIDTPPVLPIADALVIGRIASGAVLVVEAGRTAVNEVQRAKDALIRNQTRLFGVVLNGRTPEQAPDGPYGYPYGYGAG